MALRQHYLFVCTNRRAGDNPRGCCASKGAEAIYVALKEALASRGLHRLEARICRSSCLDQCATGVTLLVEPDHFFYGHTTLADVPEIVESLAHGRRVERLILNPEQLAEG